MWAHVGSRIGFHLSGGGYPPKTWVGRGPSGPGRLPPWSWVRTDWENKKGGKNNKKANLACKLYHMLLNNNNTGKQNNSPFVPAKKFNAICFVSVKILTIIFSNELFWFSKSRTSVQGFFLCTSHAIYAFHFSGKLSFCIFGTGFSEILNWVLPN